MSGAQLQGTRAAVPERGWIRTLETDDVTIAVNRFGRGQAIYFAHEIMRQSFEDGHLDFSGLLMRAIELGLGEARVLRTNAPPSVRCSLLTDNAGGYTLSLVNHTSTPYRPLRTLVPVRDIEATLRLPQRTLKSWSALTPASGVEVATGPDGHVKVRVSHLQAFASVALTMENQPSGGGR